MTRFNAANALKRELAKRTAKHEAPVEDNFSQAVGRQLEPKGIAQFLGLPKDEPPDKWDLLTQFAERQRALEAEWEAKRQADEDAKNAPQTTAGILAAELANAATNSDSSHIALNSAQILRAALAGGSGTINGSP